MSHGRAHPPELRAAVVAAILAGESVSAVARRFGVGHATAISWSAELRPVRPADARTREELAELAYDAIAETLRSLAARARATGQADWIAKQSAAELAQLVAADWDRVIRMVAGFRPAEPDQPALPDRADSVDASD